MIVARPDAGEGGGKSSKFEGAFDVIGRGKEVSNLITQIENESGIWEKRGGVSDLEEGERLRYIARLVGYIIALRLEIARLSNNPSVVELLRETVQKEKTRRGMEDEFDELVRINQMRGRLRKAPHDLKDPKQILSYVSGYKVEDIDKTGLDGGVVEEAITEMQEAINTLYQRLKTDLGFEVEKADPNDLVMLIKFFGAQISRARGSIRILRG